MVLKKKKLQIFEKIPLLVLTHDIELTSCFLPWVSPLLNNPTPPHDLPAHSEGFSLSSSCSGRFLTVGPSLYLSLELWIWVPVLHRSLTFTDWSLAPKLGTSALSRRVEKAWQIFLPR